MIVDNPINLPEEWFDEIQETLIHAKNTFYRYAKLHRAKGTDEGDAKACDNAGMGEEMADALETLARIRKFYPRQI